jgi:15-hydroxyprostaglandin dehydrogenase (NAD)
MSNFKDYCVCLVTGAASGIGLATSQHLLSEKRKVVLVDKNDRSLENAAKGLRSQFPEKNWMTRICDVSQESEVQAAWSAA